MAQIGDPYFFDAHPRSPIYPGVECIVVAIDPITNRPTKVQAVEYDERLLRVGFFEEDGKCVVFDLDIVTPN